MLSRLAGTNNITFLLDFFNDFIGFAHAPSMTGRWIGRKTRITQGLLMNKWQETVIAKEPFGTLKTPLTKRFVHLIAPRPFTHPSRDSGLLLDCRHQ